MNAISLQSIFQDKLFFQAFVVILAVVVFSLSNFAFANSGSATFSLDVSSILTGIAVIVAAVTSIGLAAMSVVLVTKAFKYVKSAF